MYIRPWLWAFGRGVAFLRGLRWAVAAGATVVLMACASVQSVRVQAAALPVDNSLTSSSEEINPDPWESFNRDITTFNDSLDDLLVKPVARAYKLYTPNMVRTTISNFFFNLSSVPSAANNMLQGRIQAAAEGLIRVGVNTVFGFGGLIDVASEMNIERHKADFGQTLGRWGVPTGPYLVVPFLGPTTLRDAAASVMVSKDEVIFQIPQVSLRNSLYTLRAIEQRANLLRATTVLDEAALDRYTFTRDIFLQVRRNEVLGDAGEPGDTGQAPD